MKKLLIYTAAVVLVGGLILWFIAPKEKANEKKDNREYATLLLQVHTEEASDVTPEITMEKTLQCIENRLDCIIPHKFNATVLDSNKIQINIAAKEYSDTSLAQRIRHIIQTQGYIQFLPVFSWPELLPQIDSITSLLRRGHYGYASPGSAHQKDTARISQMFNNLVAQNLLPKNMKVMWTAEKISEDSLHDLLIVEHDGTPQVDGDDIDSASAELEENGCASVSITMTKAGAIKWADLTGKNVGKNIAIVLDGLVYSYPIVNQRIDCGASTISGNFSEEEAHDLAAILTIGRLPVRVTIQDVALSE